MRAAARYAILVLLLSPWAAADELKTTVELSVRAPADQPLAGQVDLGITGVSEPLRGVVSLRLFPTAKGREHERIPPRTTSFEVAQDGERSVVLGRDLVFDPSELAAGEYRAVVEVVLRGMDSWAMAQDEALVELGAEPPEPAPKPEPKPKDPPPPPAGERDPLAGLSLRDGPDGIEVLAVEGRPRGELDLRKGDLIVFAILPDEDATEVELHSVKELRKHLGGLRGGAELCLGLVRGEEVLVIPLVEEEWEVDEPESDASALEDLLARLRSKDPEERAKAVEEIGTLDATALPVVPALAAALADRSAIVRAAAASTLREIGPAPGLTKTVPALLRALEDGEADVRLEVVRTLMEVAALSEREDQRRIGRALHEAATSDPDPRVRAAAADG